MQLVGAQLSLGKDSNVSEKITYKVYYNGNNVSSKKVKISTKTDLVVPYKICMYVCV